MRRPAPGLVVHANQGSQSRAIRFKDLLARHGAAHEPARQLLRGRLRNLPMMPDKVLAALREPAWQ